MILIADSGSTKTDWRWVDGTKVIKSASTEGINPYQQNESQIQSIISALPVDQAINVIHYYGAGCGAPKNQNVIKCLLQSHFAVNDVTVDNDLLAAARAMCGRQPGFVAIIGTGCNAGLYDGQQFIEKVPSPGYVLGDEGSGNWLGRNIIADYFRHQLDADTSKVVSQFLDNDLSAVLEKVYMQERPAAYLASLAKIVAVNRALPYFENLILKGFQLFFETNVKYFKDIERYPLHFTGSIAYHYADLLRKVASANQLKIGDTQSSPIDGLIQFYTEK